MPNDKDVIGSGLNSFVELLNAKAAQVSAAFSDHERIQQAQKAIINLSNTVNQYANNMSTLSPNAYEEFQTALKDYSKNMVELIGFAGSNHDFLSEDEKACYASAMELAGIIRANDDKLRSIRDTLKFSSRFKAEFKDNINKDAMAHMERIGVAGHRPTIEECRNLSIDSSAPETVFDRMLWLHDQQYSLSQADPDHPAAAPGFYQETLNRLHSELENAAPEKQAEYAALFIRHDIMLKGRANQSLRKYEKEAPKEMKPEEKADYAKQQLATDSTFLDIRGFSALRDSFQNTRMGEVISHLETGSNGVPLLDPAAFPRMHNIGTLVNGGMDSFLREKNLFDQTAQTNRETMQRKSASVDTRSDSTISRLGALYQAMLNDAGKASPSFTAMRDALIAVASIDHSDPSRSAEYLTALSKARGIAQAYLDTHPGYRHTKSGKQRVEMAQQLKSLAARQYNHHMEQQQIWDREAANSIAKNIKGKSEPEVLREISKLNKHITPVSIVPKEPAFSSEVTTLDEVKGETKHILYNISHGICMPFNGIGKAIVSTKYKISEKRPDTELDLDSIPGRNGEKFKDYDPDAPENGGNVQKILSDSRRPPLAWEQLIPEDPNQPPTITFEFDQGREGDPTAYPLVVKDGIEDNEMGHGFVTLNYTKNNPFSGKPERYKVSFGFYPKGGFTADPLMAAQITKGMTVPGQLNQDNDHEMSTGLTYTVSNREINKVILAAQHYEKDGYNFFARNCTTFVSDMSKAAGLDLSNVLKEVDLTSEGNDKTFAGLNAGGTSAMFHIAQSSVMNKVGRDDMSYQRFGQKMLNKEDVVRIENAKKVFNKRMKGYTPGHATESARVDKNFRLHSTKYDFKVDIADNEDKKLSSDERTVLEGKTKIQMEVGNLCATIIRRGEKDGVKSGELDNAVNHIMEYTQDMLKAVDFYAQKGFLEIDPEKKGKDAEVYWTDQKKALADGYATLGEMVQGFDEIYHSTFKGDSELNVPFQHMVSVITHYKDKFASRYREANDEMVFTKESLESPGTMSRINSDLDTERDSYQALRAFRFGTFKMVNEVSENGEIKKVESKQLEPARVAALIQAFGSYEEGMKVVNREKELDKKKKAEGELTREEQKELDTLERKTQTMRVFENAQKSYFEDRDFTIGDYTYAFIELPNGLNGGTPTVPENTPGEILQTIAIEKIFGGTKKLLKQEMEEAAGQIRNPKISASSKRGRQNLEILDEKLASAKEKILQHLSAKMVEKHDDFKMLTDVCVERAKLLTPPDPGKSKEEWGVEIAEKSEQFLVNTIMEKYMKPLCEDVFNDMSGRLPGKLTYESVLEADDIILNPEFRKMQKQVNKDLGITRVDPLDEKIRREEEARRIEEERRREEERLAAERKRQEEERKKAEEERKKAEAERKKAEAEKRRLEAEQKRLEAQKNKAKNKDNNKNDEEKQNDNNPASGRRRNNNRRKNKANIPGLGGG